MAQLGAAGSVKAAEVARRYEEMALPRAAGRYDEMGAPAHQGAMGFQINMIVPRPPEAMMPAGFHDGPIRIPAAVLDQAADMGGPPRVDLLSNASPKEVVPAEVSLTDDPLLAVLGPTTKNGR